MLFEIRIASNEGRFNLHECAPCVDQRLKYSKQVQCGAQNLIGEFSRFGFRLDRSETESASRKFSHSITSPAILRGLECYLRLDSASPYSTKPTHKIAKCGSKLQNIQEESVDSRLWIGGSQPDRWDTESLLDVGLET